MNYTQLEMDRKKYLRLLIMNLRKLHRLAYFIVKFLIALINLIKKKDKISFVLIIIRNILIFMEIRKTYLKNIQVFYYYFYNLIILIKLIFEKNLYFKLLFFILILLGGGPLGKPVP